MKSYLVAISLVAAAALGIRAANETGTGTGPHASQPNIDATDTKVITDLHQANLKEIEMGNLAQENGDSIAVRNYGLMLVNDHQAAEEQVLEVAGEKGINLSDKAPVASKKEQQKITEMKKLEGPSFDRTFAASMVEEHKKAIKNLEAARTNATGRTVELIEQMLPVLKEHQQAAEQLVLELKQQVFPNAS